MKKSCETCYQGNLRIAPIKTWQLFQEEQKVEAIAEHTKRAELSQANYTYQAYCILNIDRRSIGGIKVQSIPIIT